MSSGERPIGAAKGTQSDTEALCQAPPPLLLHCPRERALLPPPPLPAHALPGIDRPGPGHSVPAPARGHDAPNCSAGTAR